MDVDQSISPHLSYFASAVGVSPYPAEIFEIFFILYSFFSIQYNILKPTSPFLPFPFWSRNFFCITCPFSFILKTIGQLISSSTNCRGMPPLSDSMCYILGMRTASSLNADVIILATIKFSCNSLLYYQARFVAQTWMIQVFHHYDWRSFFQFQFMRWQSW